MENKKWQFHNLTDGLKTTTGATIGLGILGIGLAHLFTPVALAVATGYGLAQVAEGAALMIPKVKEFYINNEIKKGRWQEVSADEPALKMAAEISQQLGRKEAPKMYTVDRKTVGKFALPFGMRWAIKIDELAKKVMPGVFAALPGTNTLITTREALDRKMDEKQLKFIVAHEMSHLHARDNLSPALQAKMFMKKAATALFWGTLAAGALSVVGLALPVVAGTSTLLALGGLTAVYAGAKIANNFGMRAVEERADRNAMYITRDFESGKAGLASIDPTAEKPGKWPMYKEVFIDHPSFWRRIETLKASFDKAVQYPELPAPKALAPAPKPAPAPTV